MTEKQSETSTKIFKSLTEAADYTGTTRQAVKVAIEKGHLKAEKKYIVHPKSKALIKTWHITLEDLEDYRRNKYNSEKKQIDGQKVFDYNADRWSVSFTAKVLSVAWGIPVPFTRIYYFLRTGQLRAQKKGINWVINPEDVKRLAEEKDSSQSVEIKIV